MTHHPNNDNMQNANDLQIESKLQICCSKSFMKGHVMQKSYKTKVTQEIQQYLKLQNQKSFSAADKTFLVQTLVLLERTLFTARINIELYFLGFVVQLVLLHGEIGRASCRERV